MFVAPFIVFDKHHQLTEYFAKVTSVNFIDDEEIGASIILGTLAEVEEYSVSHNKALFRRTNALNEVFISIGLVELNHFDTRVVLFAKDRICDLFGKEGLSNTGRALKNDVFLSF